MTPILSRPHASALLASLSLVACSSSPGPGTPSQPGSITCPPPIGPIARESCADVAKDYDVISVDGALKSAGTGPGSEKSVAAIKAAGSLASALKERRVALCEESNACKVTPKDRDARDKALADLMNELVKLWDKRALSDPASVERFHEEVRALQRSLDPGGQAASAGGPKAPAPSAPGAEILAKLDAVKLTRAPAAGLTFAEDGGSITITSKDSAPHDALRAPSDQSKLTAGKRYLVKITGSYTPASPPLFAPGDEIRVRLKYRATEACALYAAARSLEDPESDEATTEWKIAAGEKGSREATLTAPPGSTGVYVGVGIHGAGSIDLDDIEVSRGGNVIAAARAESDAEPSVKTTCAFITTKPITSKRSFRCVGGAAAAASASAGAGDKLMIGLPASHFYVAVRGASGADRAILRTLSLDGGRILDATLSENAELVLGLSGPGAATLRSVEISALAK